MKIRVDFTEEEMRNALVEYLRSKTGLDINSEDIIIEVKSKQNYKSEWESADFRGYFLDLRS